MITTGIDWAMPRIDCTARRACRVCDLTYVVAIDYDGPPLCEDDRRDIAATRTRVRALLDVELAQEQAALDTWDAYRELNQKWWDRIQSVSGEPDYKLRCDIARREGNVYGKLLDAHAAFVAEVERLSVERARLEKALEVLNEQA